MHRLINRYFIAQMFLTRLPVPASLRHSDEELAASTAFFPLVGLVVGTLAALAYSLAEWIWSAQIAAVVAIATAVILTGAFHEDGLADSADGLGGSFDRKRKLTIMRDSRIGTYGSVALILMIMLKYQMLAAMSPQSVPWVIVCAHSIARWTALPLIIYNPYVREEGTGKPFAASVSKQSLAIGSALTLAITVAMTGVNAVAIIIGVAILLVLAQRFLKKQLGGVTGDTLGAVNSCAELTVYAVVAAQW